MQNIQLSIPTPCHENWNNMTPVQQGRFCTACAKQVVDFSSMSDKEVLNYFSTVKDKEVCGRAFPQQLERSIENNPRKPGWFCHRYLKYAALLLLFFKAGGAKAQGKIAVKPLPNKPGKQQLSDCKSPVIKADNMPPIAMGMMITQAAKTADSQAACAAFAGYVSDENGVPLAGASIVVHPAAEGVATDTAGRFLLTNFKPGSIIKVSCVGYNDTSIAIKQTGQTITLYKNEPVLQEVVVRGYAMQGRTVMTGAVSSVSACYRLKDSIVKRVTGFNPFIVLNPTVNIYPNPVVKGNMLHVSVNFKKEGQYSLQIMDAAGRQVFQQKIQATSKNYLNEMVAEQSWGSGMFIIRISDAKNKVVKTERFIAL